MDMSAWHYLQTSDAVEDVKDIDSGIALRDFLAANYQHLQRRLLRHLGCSDLASDCLHDAWLRLGEMTLSAAVQNPEAYVYRVACNIAMDRLRSNRLSGQYMGDAGIELDTIADPSPGPDRIAEVRSDVAALDRALQHLPRRHQAVLIALRIDELTRDEVAVYHGISLRCVDTTLRQALDYCAGKTSQMALAGVCSRRHAKVMPVIETAPQSSCELPVRNAACLLRHMREQRPSAQKGSQSA